MTRGLGCLAVLAACPLARRRRGWCLLAAAPGGCAALDPAAPQEPGAARVVRVIDGDTLIVRAGGRRVTARLVGIDTPETHPGAAECGGRAASRRLARLARAGTRVRLTSEPRSGDTHDRLRAAARVRRRPPRRPRRAPAARRPRLRLPLPRLALVAARPPPARA